MSDLTPMSHRDRAPTPDEQAGHCFGCGPGNPQGMHLEFTVDAEANTARADINLGRFYEGPPGHIHGGIIATLMDEAMSKLNKPLGVLAVTRHMEVDYPPRGAASSTTHLDRATHSPRGTQALSRGQTQATRRHSAGAGQRSLHRSRPGGR